MRSDTTTFIEKAVAKHGQKYGYENVEYEDRGTAVSITCKQCSKDFMQTPHEHLAGCGCPPCSNLTRGKVRMTQETFIAKAKSKHSPPLDYSLVRYINYDTKVSIKCPKHDYVYQQSPKKHLQQRGCPYCHRKGFSDVAISWLQYKSACEGQDIRHALNGGEIRLPNIGKVDGYCSALNKVYEFHGSKYHGNPSVYLGHQRAYNGVMMCELYFKTVERELKIRQAGYEYEEIWDIEWYKLQRSAKIIQYAWRCFKSNKPFIKLSRYPGTGKGVTSRKHLPAV